MIDWFRGEIDFLHDPIPAGRVLSIESDGSIAWECVKSIDCRSSHETSVKIKSTGGDGQGRATSLMIDGNLSKFLQGHNVFGSRDLNTLLLLTFRKVFDLHAEHLHGCSSPLLTEAKIKKGDYLVKMLDINQLYDVGNDQSVEAWLHAAHMRASSRPHINNGPTARKITAAIQPTATGTTRAAFRRVKALSIGRHDIP